MSTSLQNNINKAAIISKAFIAWNILFFIASLLLKNKIADDAVGSVFLRGGVYALGGIISVLAPLGVVAFIIFTPHLPIWFDAGQIGSALMLIAIATIILKRDVRSHFPKHA
jgi:hypothetical protein